MARRRSSLLLCLGLVLVAGCTPKPTAQYLKLVSEARALNDDPRVYVDNSRVDQGLQLAMAAIVSQPRIPLAYVQAARARSLGGQSVSSPNDIASAEVFARRAIEHGAEDCEARSVLAGELYRRKDYAEGLRELDKADGPTCSYPWRHVYRGLILNAQQHDDEAAQAFARVPRGAADSPDARHAYVQAQQGLAWIAFHRGDVPALHEHALAALQQADPEDPGARVGTSDLLLRAGNFEEATDLARAALKMKNDAAGREALANALYGQSVWLSSRGGDVEAGARIMAMEAEAAGIDTNFVRAGKVLTDSLATRDEAFRLTLQQRLQGAIQQARGDSL